MDSSEVYYQRVDILDVPGSGIGRRNAVDIRFVQGEHGYRGAKIVETTQERRSDEETHFPILELASESRDRRQG